MTQFTGKMLDNTLGKWHFWTLFHRLLDDLPGPALDRHPGHARRVTNYPDLPGDITTLNQISSIGSWILGVSTFFFLYNVYKTWKFGRSHRR